MIRGKVPYSPFWLQPIHTEAKIWSSYHCKIIIILNTILRAKETIYYDLFSRFHKTKHRTLQINLRHHFQT